MQSGYFAFGFYQEGQRLAIGIWLLDGTPNKTLVWAANRNNPISANATLVLAEDNILALTSEKGELRFVTGQLNKHIYSASMLDNGNFVLYSSDSQIIWQSFDSPTHTILAGQSLRHAFIELYSTLSRTNHTSGRFKLDLYEDRLLLSPVDTPDGDFSYYWELLSPKKDFHKLNLDENGHMYLVTSNDEISKNVTGGWPSSNGTMVIYRATLDKDGVFRLYSHSVRKNGSSTVEIKWPDNKCSVNGICGFNSYCTLVSGQTDCMCLPGFDYTNPDDRSAGCKMRWGDGGFESEEKRMTDSIISLENTEFTADSYDSYSNVLGLGSKDCKEACLKDGNCVAALHGTQCYKLKLPLRYGKRSTKTI